MATSSRRLFVSSGNKISLSLPPAPAPFVDREYDDVPIEDEAVTVLPSSVKNGSIKTYISVCNGENIK